MEDRYINVFKSASWGIIQNVIFPLKSILDEEINVISSSLYISLHIQRHNGITVGGLSINEQILEITPQTPITNNIRNLFEYVIDAQYVEYSIRDNRRELYSFKVNFEKDSCMISIIGKKFQYGTFPQTEDWERIKEVFRKGLGKYYG